MYLERERGREGERDRDRGRQTDRQSQRRRQRQTQTAIERERDRETERKNTNTQEQTKKRLVDCTPMLRFGNATCIGRLDGSSSAMLLPLRRNADLDAVKGSRFQGNRTRIQYPL